MTPVKLLVIAAMTLAITPMALADFDGEYAPGNWSFYTDSSGTGTLDALEMHLLGIDDGPFDRFGDANVRVVGVMMEGPDLVEAVALTGFPVDGDDVTGFLGDWVSGLRFRPALQGLVFGGSPPARAGRGARPRPARRAPPGPPA